MATKKKADKPKKPKKLTAQGGIETPPPPPPKP
jgi:hypothetical protein